MHYTSQVVTAGTGVDASATSRNHALKIRASKRFCIAFWAMLAAGLVVRCVVAGTTFLNPDEALHCLLASEPNLRASYTASLTTVHPPLLILLLHLLGGINAPEIILRLPSIIAGMLFCWVMYQWLAKVEGLAAARVSFALFLFLPSFIDLSSEVRQYAPLLLFASATMLLFDMGVEDDSWQLMSLASAALWLALLTHYSAVIFAVVLAIYALLRFAGRRCRARTAWAWVIGQLAAIGICFFLYFSHVRMVRAAGTSQFIADTWLRMSMFHRGQDHVASFSLTGTVQLFRYFFSHGTIGVFGLILFLLGCVQLVRSKGSASERKPRRVALALLLFAPFCLVLGLAMAGVYPYGGTRHDALLGMFAIPGASIGLIDVTRRRPGLSYGLLALAIIGCNLFPHPAPPHISFRDQQKARMESALEFLGQSAAPNAFIFADHPSGLLLSYYLCHARVVPFQPVDQALMKSPCGEYQLVTPVRQPWSFQAGTLGERLAQIQQTYGLPPGTPIYIFQAGWFDSKNQAWLAALARSGCVSPRRFGTSILVCEIRENSSAVSIQPSAVGIQLAQIRD